MTNSKTTEWQQVRTAEDLLALLHRIDDRRRIIRTHAWREGSWSAVFAESTAMRDELAQLKHTLSTTWRQLHAAAQQRNED